MKMTYLGPVWCSSQQLHELWWAVFFFAKHLFLKQLHRWSCFSSPLTKTWVGMKLKKVAYCSSLPHFSLIYTRSSWWSYFTEHFFQNSSASSRKLLMKLFSKKTALLVKLSCAKQALVRLLKLLYSISGYSFLSTFWHEYYLQMCAFVQP